MNQVAATELSCGFAMESYAPSIQFLLSCRFVKVQRYLCRRTNTQSAPKRVGDCFPFSDAP
jgi:O-succinylbenzoate synthase